MAKEYDIIVLGAGPGGYPAAIRASQLGANVAIIEKKQVGGTCLNVGCIPTKAMVRAQEVLLDCKRAGEFGILVDNIRLDFAKLMERKDAVVNNLRAGTEKLLEGNHCDLYKTTGTIIGPGTIRLGNNDEELKAKKIIIATGSVSTPVEVEGVENEGVITSDEILALTKLPESLCVIGGGVIGMEFASIFNAYGSQTSVVVTSPRILRLVDEELARRYNVMLKKQGVNVMVNTSIKKVAKSDGGLLLTFEGPSGETTLEAEKLLLAKGRSPFIQGAGLENIGVETNRGRVVVNEYLETNVPNVYAIGDVIGGKMLAHEASYEGEVAAENACGHKRAVEYHAIPDCIFTTPEISGVGRDEESCKKAGIAYKVSKFPFSALGRAQAMGETDGLVKILTDEGSGVIIGAQILGPRAADLIAELALAVQNRMTAAQVAHTVHAHPTLPEAVQEAALGQLDGSIHYLGRGR
jgi:dihydrolipoamide dehydrogenase